jgi:osmotically-inducible protein OsmY
MRRVLLLQTDERAGLAAALTSTCAARGVSLEISTGPGHVLLTFEADNETTDRAVDALKQVAGVDNVHSYSVAV